MIVQIDLLSVALIIIVSFSRSCKEFRHLVTCAVISTQTAGSGLRYGRPVPNESDREATDRFAPRLESKGTIVGLETEHTGQCHRQPHPRLPRPTLLECHVQGHVQDLGQRVCSREGVISAASPRKLDHSRYSINRPNLRTSNLPPVVIGRQNMDIRCGCQDPRFCAATLHWC